MNQRPASRSLVADDLNADPRIGQAQKLLLDAVEAHQKKITSIRPPDPARKQHYDDLLATFASYRGNKLWYPFLGSGIGNGALVELLDGSVKYDFIAGIGTHYWGHSHPELIKTSIEAAISDTIMQGHLQQNEDAVELSKLLIDASGMDHCFLATSGAMSNENALKIIFQKRYPANRILSFERCFAGRTWALSQITDKASFRDGVPLNVFVDYLPFFDAARPQESTDRAVAVLKEYLKRYPKQHACMILELVQGESGFYPGSKEFFQALIRILKDNHISVFIDEVQTFGRTPSLFAFQHFGLEEFVDVVSIGKLTQVCATLYKNDHNPRPGLLSQTFLGSTSAIRAAKVIVGGLINGDYFGPNGKITRIFHYFSNKLKEIEKRHPGHIRGPYGIGSMIAFTPFDGDTQRVTKYTHALFEAGVIGFIAGSNPTRVRFLVPAGAVTEKDIDQVVAIVEKCLLSA